VLLRRLPRAHQKEVVGEQHHRSADHHDDEHDHDSHAPDPNRPRARLPNFPRRAANLARLTVTRLLRLAREGPRSERHHREEKQGCYTSDEADEEGVVALPDAVV